MQLGKLLEELNIAAANGVELDADELKARDLLTLLRRVDERSGDRQQRSAAASAAAASARLQRESAASLTFPGTPRAADDLVLVGKGPARHWFRLLHRADDTIEYFGQNSAVVVGADRVHRSVRDGDTLDGHTPRVYGFSDHLTIHYIPRAIFAALPRHHQDRLGARSSAPDDLWRWTGGVEALLGRRDHHVLPSQEELAKATDAGLSQCRDLVDGCVHGDLLRRWRDAAVASGNEANTRLITILSNRLAKLGEPLKGTKAA